MNSVVAQLGLDTGPAVENSELGPESEVEAQAPEPSPAPAPERAVPEYEAPEVEASADAEAVEQIEGEQRQESPAQRRIRQEIDKRKNLETELEQQRQHVALMEQRWQQLMANAEQQQKPAEPQAPDFDEDPAAHLLWQQQQLQKQVEQQQQMAQQQRAMAEQQQRAAVIQQHYESMEAQYAQQQPDYYPKIEALKQARIEMWRSQGLNEQEALATVQEEAWGVVQRGLQNGKNPAEAFYQMASGLQPNMAAAPNMQPVAPSAPRASSIGSRGSSPKGAPSFSDLSKMTDEEFAKATAGDKWRKLAGG